MRLSPPSSAPRLLCLPHAGGRGDAYRRWVADSAGELELWSTDLAGRHSRAGEPLVTDADVVIAELAAAAGALGDRPLAIFGHSMGAVLGFELTRALERTGTAPSALFVSGCVAPHTRRRATAAERDDAELIGLLRQWGGTPQALLDDPEFLALALPPLRADLGIADRYTPPAGTVRTPITAFAGTEDDAAPVDDVRAWSAYTDRWRGLRVLPGGHFFLHDSVGAILDEVLAACVAA